MMVLLGYGDVKQIYWIKLRQSLYFFTIFFKTHCCGILNDERVERQRGGGTSTNMSPVRLSHEVDHECIQRRH